MPSWCGRRPQRYNWDFFIVLRTLRSRFRKGAALLCSGESIADAQEIRRPRHPEPDREGTSPQFRRSDGPNGLPVPGILSLRTALLAKIDDIICTLKPNVGPDSSLAPSSQAHPSEEPATPDVAAVGAIPTWAATAGARTPARPVSNRLAVDNEKESRRVFIPPGTRRDPVRTGRCRSRARVLLPGRRRGFDSLRRFHRCRVRIGIGEHHGRPRVFGGGGHGPALGPARSGGRTAPRPRGAGRGSRGGARESSYHPYG